MSNAAATRASGIAIAASPATETSRAVAETRAILGPVPFQHIIAFFGIDHDADAAGDALERGVPRRSRLGLLDGRRDRPRPA